MPTTSNPNSFSTFRGTPRDLALHNNHHEIVALFDDTVIPPHLTKFLWQLKHHARRYFVHCNSYRINANTTALLITAVFGIFWLKRPHNSISNSIFYVKRIFRSTFQILFRQNYFHSNFYFKNIYHDRLIKI